MDTDRLDPYRAVARASDLDAVVLVPGVNLTRTLGQAFHENERPLVILIPVEGEPSALVPNLELTSFEATGFDGAIFDWRDQSGYREAFESMMRETPCRRLGVEGLRMRVFVSQALEQAAEGIVIVDTGKQIDATRLCKTPDEIAGLRLAIETSETALAETLDHVRIGMSEMAIQRRLTQALFAAGAEDFAFSPIVAAGDNSSRPHAHAREAYAIRAGDTLLLDFGARRKGMNADITRTVFVGSCSDRQASVYETVRMANEAGRAAARPGATAEAVDKAATDVLEASEFHERIRHKTGHGLGREVHEDPHIMQGNREILEPGMVFTVEPGLYQEGDFGVRIEDDVLVTAEGSESLTSFDRQLRVLPG